MSSQFNIKILEEIFSEDFNSPVYAILAEEYLNLGDFDRASTVCNIGLENDPQDLAGKYLLAKIYFFQDKKNESRKILNQILNQFPIHLNARQLIIKILKQQGDKSKLAGHIEKLNEYFPNAKPANSSNPSLKTENVKEEKDNLNKISKVKDEKEQSDVNNDKKSSNIKESFVISKNMATFTFVDILINQKHYSEALEILDLLEKKGKQKKKIKEKREHIKKAMDK